MNANNAKESSIKNSTNINLRRVKSKLILKIIFENLANHKKYKIIQYNKTIQNRLDLNLIDFYLKNLSPIEIEIQPHKYKRVKFINIPNGNERYFRIYLDNYEDKEKYFFYLYENHGINKIKIIISYQIISFRKLFESCFYIQKIDFKKFNRTNIINMKDMIFGCSYL